MEHYMILFLRLYHCCVHQSSLNSSFLFFVFLFLSTFGLFKCMLVCVQYELGFNSLATLYYSVLEFFCVFLLFSHLLQKCLQTIQHLLSSGFVCKQSSTRRCSLSARIVSVSCGSSDFVRNSGRSLLLTIFFICSARSKLILCSETSAVEYN